MAAFTNLSFETASPFGPGLALGWTRVVVATAEEWATFGPSGASWEGFGGGWWAGGAYLFGLTPPDLAPLVLPTASLDPKLIEDFEELWSGVEAYLFELSGTVAWGVEAFGVPGWLAAFTATLDSTNTAGAVLTDGNPTDTFAAGWKTDGYLTALGATSHAVIRHFGPDGVVEGFELFVRPVEMFADVAENRIRPVLGSSEFGEDTAIVFLLDDPAGTLPAPLSTLNVYRTFDHEPGGFKVVAENGGPPLVLTSPGTGGFHVAYDPRGVWNQALDV